MYNQAKQQVKGGNKRELIQLGAPIFGPIKEDAIDHCPKSKWNLFNLLLQRLSHISC